MSILALKIDVDTLRGTREGVPALLDLLRRHQVGATFLFSVGPDHTGRAIKRIFRPGFFSKVRRTSVVQHYGVTTLLYGTALPGPDIGRRAGDTMLAVRDEGFETGLHCWDHVKWQDGVAGADADWTARQMRLACERYTEVFKEPPRVHGAAGWQMNVDALRQTQVLGFDYCSDGRGTHPHLPVWNAELIRCPQLPTTLPTLDELIGIDGATADDAAGRLLALTAPPGNRRSAIQPRLHLARGARGPASRTHARAVAERLEGAGLPAVIAATPVRNVRADGAAALRGRPGPGAGPQRYLVVPAPGIPG